MSGGGAAGGRASVAVGAVLVVVAMAAVAAEGASWCIARSSASPVALQTALDYACDAGADCSPIQPSGLCYLPNTLQAHASYAFNSYYQRRNYAPGSCEFAGTATTTITDPSYGSCTYPSSPSNAGAATSPATSSATPAMNTPKAAPGATTAAPSTTTSPSFGGAGVGGLKPGFGPGTTDATSPAAAAVPPLAHLLACSIAAILLA
ncbi:unnamed protein product [Spirodela intermedia]|uniref:X8 domain-containing protein n=2 Tax=Spirodela intermedia TaxID=51605 RepID=A0A7I8IPT4_SPIIN|nr:unnamed protein product [Spirodela intermedia]CAA6659890.1 unnamed protein product [Spirodela intermedia]CAA7396213.1 unnamed protein product [Spirodela intermedia]